MLTFQPSIFVKNRAITGGTSEYPWSSYQHNALGNSIELITPHPLYSGLAKVDKTRQFSYQALFENKIPDYTLEEIRESINRAWVLGDGRFKQQIESKTGRRATPLVRGGDRKSKKYRASKDNQLL